MTQTIFTCSICDQTTGDPTYTDLGLACEDCLKNDPDLQIPEVSDAGYQS